jgi:hypothetical protein
MVSKRTSAACWALVWIVDPACVILCSSMTLICWVAKSMVKIITEVICCKPQCWLNYITMGLQRPQTSIWMAKAGLILC